VRDIRPDLQERIDEIDREMARLEASVVLLRSARQRYRDMLNEENARWQTVSGNGGSTPNGSSINAQGDPRPQEDPKGRTPLARLVLEVLSDGEVHTERDVMEQAVARKYPFGEKNPLNVVHFAMIGMGQNKTIHNAGKAAWRLPMNTG
jgi:hypothetical protein